jgi:2-oxoglutarate dehydrogenase E2 component (dihydrolipoamide succinyltransferase)
MATNGSCEVPPMAVEIKIPALGESITEGRIAQWLKPDGALVKTDEPVFELETEKASTEIAAPADGVLHILAKEGETVRIGAVVARIEPAPAGADQPAKAAPPAAKAAPPPAAKPAPAANPAPAATPNGPRGTQAQPQAQPSEPVLSPAARRVAEEEHIDASTIHGTGRGGRIVKEDVLQAKEQAKRPTEQAQRLEAPVRQEVSPSPTPRSDGARESRQRMSAIRKRIAERLVQSQQTTATLTTFNEADMSAIMDLRTRYKERFKEKHGVGLGFMSFFVKAVVEGLKAFPVVNARIEGEELVFQHFYDIGVAVSTERGLMVPVIRDADKLSFADIEKRLGELAAKARDGKISVADLQGGTFTITNGGVFGSLLSTPILNPPQSAILGMHTIQKRPVVVGEQIVIRPMMYLALSYDHRLIDGREAVLFLGRIKESIEAPGSLLLDL